MIQEDVSTHLKNKVTWKRVFHIVVLAFIIGLVRMMLWAIVIFQVASTLISGQPNQQLLRLGNALSGYVYAVLLFLTFNSHRPPFPFADWPGQIMPFDQNNDQNR